jgi:hypothetical protein
MFEITSDDIADLSEEDLLEAGRKLLRRFSFKNGGGMRGHRTSISKIRGAFLAERRLV